MTYLIITLLLCSLILSGVFLLAWQNFGRHPHVLAWSAAYLCGAVHCTVKLFSDTWFDDGRFYWLVDCAFGVLTVSLALAGFRLWSGRWIREDILVLAGFAVVLSVGWFTYGEPHAGMQMFLGPAYGGALYLVCATLVLKQKTSSRDVEFAAAGVLGLYGGAQILAGLSALSQGASVDAGWVELYSDIKFMVLPAGYLGSGLITVVLLASDLSLQMKKLARKDVPTGALNRDGFVSASAPLIARARRSKQALSVIVCDVDNFKDVDNQQGQGGSDRALTIMGKALQANLREGDLFGRLDDHEFALTLPGTDSSQAEQTARRLRMALADTEIGWRSEPFHIMASFGISSLHDDDHSIEDVLHRANRVIYRSRRNGSKAPGKEADLSEGQPANELPADYG